MKMIAWLELRLDCNDGASLQFYQVEEEENS